MENFIYEMKYFIYEIEISYVKLKFHIISYMKFPHMKKKKNMTCSIHICNFHYVKDKPHMKFLIHI